MVDRIQKTLNRLSDKEKGALLAMARQIERGDVKRLDIKKLKGVAGIYRARQGKFRIVYRLEETGKNKVLAIERRSETTYNNF